MKLRKSQLSGLKTIMNLTQGGAGTTTMYNIASKRQIATSSARSLVLRLQEHGAVKYATEGRGFEGEVTVTAAGRKAVTG